MRRGVLYCNIVVWFFVVVELYGWGICPCGDASRLWLQRSGTNAAEGRSISTGASEAPLWQTVGASTSAFTVLGALSLFLRSSLKEGRLPLTVILNTVVTPQYSAVTVALPSVTFFFIKTVAVPVGVLLPVFSEPDAVPGVYPACCPRGIYGRKVGPAGHKGSAFQLNSSCSQKLSATQISW